MSYNKLGFTSGQTLKAEHLNYMEEGIANAGGGVTSWNDLEDKPFYDETPEPISVSTDTIGNYEVLDISGVSCVKVSDEILTKDQVLGGRFDVLMNGIVIESADIDDSTIDDSVDGALAIANEAIMAVSQTSITHGGVTLEFPSTGSYFNVEYILKAEQGWNMELQFNFPSQLKTLDAKYIPSGVGGLLVDLTAVETESVAYGIIYLGEDAAKILNTYRNGVSVVFHLAEDGNGFPIYASAIGLAVTTYNKEQYFEMTIMFEGSPLRVFFPMQG